MKSLFRGLIERVSSSVKSQTAMAVAPVLGRWGIQYDKNIIDRKIIQANEIQDKDRIAMGLNYNQSDIKKALK